ncbi:zinc finger, C4 type, putative [Ixodes scapularis]|uniref:Zinc finger, C4 type, putative n=1 Tax=Ixodes scapularis TaxID=6945 RepID=B7Q6Q3_IXOSC|nr:zinc finger, C4 type, putative [Ixodes scapularis]|eukprot:XP_002403220.1 zinc finger, C4 type, putative [Ixodes scapularis]
MPLRGIRVRAPAVGRILLDIPCKVCLDHSSGKHYGIFACDGAGPEYDCACPFFPTLWVQRSIRRNRQYVCKARGAAANGCPVDKTHRNQCRACRLRKCLEAGMNKEAERYCLSAHAQYPHEVLAAYPETICESAARLLFMNVKWMKTVTALTALPMRDQLTLLEEGWRELFVLSAAQFMLPLEVAPLLAAAGLSSEPSTSERVATLVSEIRNFQEIIARFKEMQVDATEYACVKAILLFKTCECSSTNCMPFRFGKLLLTLPCLRTVSATAIEDLFFRKTIGAIPIERLLCDMYKSGDF